MRLRAWVAVAAAVVGVLVPASAGRTEAAFGAGTASTAVLGSDLLDPPTAFTALRTCVAAAAPTVVGSTSALLLPGGGTRVTVAKPAGTAAGDVVVAYVAADQNLPGGEPNRTPVPVGETWATSEAFSGDWLASRLVVRRATSTEPAAYSFDVPDNWHATTAVLTVYRGVGTSAGWVSSANLVTYQAVSTPALTQDVAPSRLVVVAAAAYSIGAITPPASAAHTIGLSHTAEIPAVLMADEVLTSAGSTGTGRCGCRRTPWAARPHWSGAAPRAPTGSTWPGRQAPMPPTRGTPRSGRATWGSAATPRAATG